MFYILSKVIWFLIQPTSFMVILAVIGIILLRTSWQSTAKTLLTISTVSLLIMGFSPLGNIILLPLEERFPRIKLSELTEPPTGIIVLGGAASSGILKIRGTLSLNDSSERLTEAVFLARRFPNAKLVFTGGAGSLIHKTVFPEADSAEYYFRKMGIDPSRIILEDKSRNTRENALFTKKLIKPKKGEKWLLVTSAFHMSRSMGCFRQVNIPVIAWTVDYRTVGYSDRLAFFNSVSQGFSKIDLAMKEWIGLFAYWITGKIPELFPAPK